MNNSLLIIIFWRIFVAINSCIELQPRKVPCSELIARVIAVKVHRMKKFNCSRHTFINILIRYLSEVVDFPREKILDNVHGFDCWRSILSASWFEIYHFDNDISQKFFSNIWAILEKCQEKYFAFSEKIFFRF